MLLIPCPWCGLRDQTEFSCHGEAHVARPRDSGSLSDEQWGDYVFFRNNPRGFHRERWMHAFGCRQWFNLARNTVTGQIVAAYKIGDPTPTHPTPAGNDSPNAPASDNAPDSRP